jgi:hypothetical protein
VEIEELKPFCHFQKDKKFYVRFFLLRSSWELAYPAIDIKKEMAWAHAWLIAHPERHRSNMTRFLSNWMKGAEERRVVEDRRVGDRRAPSFKRFVEEIPKEEDLLTAEDWARLKQTVRR